VPRDEIPYVPTQGVAKVAGSAEMDAAKDASVGDFRNGAGETGERTSAGTRFGGNGEGGVVSESGGEDERRGAAN